MNLEKAAQEAFITINGNPLTQAQSMAIRVAIEALATDLNDCEGSSIDQAYKDRIVEIRRFMYES